MITVDRVTVRYGDLVRVGDSEVRDRAAGREIREPG